MNHSDGNECLGSVVVNMPRYCIQALLAHASLCPVLYINAVRMFSYLHHYFMIYLSGRQLHVMCMEIAVLSATFQYQPLQTSDKPKCLLHKVLSNQPNQSGNITPVLLYTHSKLSSTEQSVTGV